MVLNISSAHETIAGSSYSAYSASKAAISMLTKTLAQESARFGVRVLAVAPGAIKTTINQAVWGDPSALPDLLEKIPLARMGSVKEIADLVAVLVSDVGSYVTGTTVFADGGMTDYPDFAGTAEPCRPPALAYGRRLPIMKRGGDARRARAALQLGHCSP